MCVCILMIDLVKLKSSKIGYDRSAMIYWSTHYQYILYLPKA